MPKIDLSALEDSTPAPVAKQPKQQHRPTSKPRKDLPEKAAAERTSAYLTDEVFAEMQRAWASDLDTLEDAPRTRARWVEEAVDAYARLSPARRKKHAATIAPPTTKRTVRSWKIDPVVRAKVLTAMENDRQQAHRMVALSEFTMEAIVYAIAESTARAGGTLPYPLETAAGHRAAPQ